MSAVERRAQELDTIAAVLPMERRDELAELLTDQDIETLRHLVNEGMGENTLRALTSDLAYLQAWSLASTKHSLPWPAPEALLLKFVAHHLWDPAKRENDPDHGMPDSVAQPLRDQGFLRTACPHAPDTVRRRLASWSTLTKWRGLSGAFASPALKSAIRLAVRAAPRQRRRKSAKAVTGDVLAKMLATCAKENLRDVRDRAILMVAFASGGRRRSEIAGLRVEQISVEAPIEIENGPLLPSRAIRLGRTKRQVPITTRWSISPDGRSRRLKPGCNWRKFRLGACFEKSIAGGMFRSGRWRRVRLMPSSSSERRWPGWSRGSFRRTGCGQGISRKPRTAASPSPRRWSSRATARSNRPRNTTTAQRDAAVGRRDSYNDWSRPRADIRAEICDSESMNNHCFTYAAFGDPLHRISLEEIPLPPISPGRIRVSMIAVPVNPSDLIPVTGAYSHRIKLPAIVGYEGVGRVIDADEGYLSLIGKRVLPVRSVGTWQTYVDCDPAVAVLVPDQIDDLSACRAYINPLSALTMLERWPVEGKNVLLCSAGSMCSELLGRWAIKSGAAKVQGLFRSEARVPSLIASGIDPVSMSDGYGVALAAKSADITFDAIGGLVGSSVLQQMSPTTSFIGYGLLSGESIDASGARANYHRFHLRDSLADMSPAVWQTQFHRIWERLNEAPLPPVSVFPFNRWREALQQSAKPGGPKAVLTFKCDLG